MGNLEVTGLRKVGPSILVESSMVYLGPFLHSPNGALELNPVWALYARSLSFFRDSSALKVDEGDAGSI